MTQITTLGERVLPDLTSLQSQLQDLLARRARVLDVPGVVVGVWDGGVEVFASFGVTSLENPLAVDEDTLFQIGSVTKTFTGTALMRLVEAGQIALDAPVRRYLPGFRLRDQRAAETVTVLHLLNHTSGWAGDQGPDDCGAGDDALARFVEGLEAVDQFTTPGQVISYNNSAVNVAGRLIEVITGMTYEQAVAHLVLLPLGMRNTFFPPDEIMTRRFAVGHGSKGSGDGALTVSRQWMMSRSSAPAGGLVSGMRDMVTYGRFHLGNGIAGDGQRVTKADTLQSMQRPSTTLALDSEGMGITWHLGEVGGVPTVSHDGGTPSGSARLLLLPGLSFGLTLAVNSISSGAGILINEICALVLHDHLGLEKRAPERSVLAPSELDDLAGVYDRGQGTTLHITVRAGSLEALTVMSPELIAWIQTNRPELVIPDHQPIRLTTLTRDRYGRADQEADSVEGSFVRREDGTVLGLRWSGRLALKVS